jgi:hypothetical protein
MIFGRREKDCEKAPGERIKNPKKQPPKILFERGAHKARHWAEFSRGRFRTASRRLVVTLFLRGLGAVFAG